MEQKYNTFYKIIVNRKRKFVELKCTICENVFIRRWDCFMKSGDHKCRSCICKANALVGSANPDWVPRAKCIDCKKELGKSSVSQGIKRCKKCFDKYHTKSNHWNWKGGATNENLLARQSAEYKSWAKAVKERDDYTCQICKKRGGELHSDHIKPFCEFIDLRYDINNGRTLCVDCHYNHGWNFFKRKNPRKGTKIGTRHKSVFCINTNKVYISYNEAAKETGIGRSTIGNITNYKQKSSKGYVFRDLNEELLIF